MKEEQGKLMFRARQSAAEMAWKTDHFGFYHPGDTKDIEKLAKSLTGKRTKKK